MGDGIRSVLDVVAALGAITGIGLLIVAAYLDGYVGDSFLNWVATVVTGIGLFAGGTLFLLRRESTISDRLLRFVEDLFFST